MDEIIDRSTFHVGEICAVITIITSDRTWIGKERKGMSHKFSDDFYCMRSFPHTHKYQITCHHINQPTTYCFTDLMCILCTKITLNIHTKLFVVLDSSFPQSFDSFDSIIGIVASYHLTISMNQITSDDSKANTLKS